MQPKNLLFIMSDEHNSDFLGCAGHAMVKTPNLDALAARGTVFENAYANSPICVPSRASFATGRYVHDCGCWDNADPYDGKVASWGHRLIAQGHRVESIGKLHYRDQGDDNGFEREIIPLHVAGGVGDLVGLIRSEMPVRKSAVKFSQGVGPGETNYTAYDRKIASEAVAWLQAAARTSSDRPWVLFVSFVSPHFPLIAPQPFYDLYPESDVPWPLFYDAADRPRHSYYRQMRACLNYDSYFDEDMVRKGVAAYMGLCSFLDHNVGRILDALSACGLADDTRIIYTSDHGEALGKRGLWGKSTMFEESVGVPLIMAGPGIAAGARVSVPCSLVDCHPTIIQSVGGAPHEEDGDLPGQSLFGLAAGAVEDRVVFSEYHAMASPTGNFMIRKGKFKLSYFVGLEPELFDLEADPHETTNLASDPAASRIRADLEAELRKICRPEDVDARARSDQQARLEKHGGRDAVLELGEIGFSPAPISDTER